MQASESKLVSRLSLRPEWLALRDEAVLDPGLPIIDPHHHLWDEPGHRYLLPDLLADIAGGHDIRATVFVECGAMYRGRGDSPYRPVGEVEFANGVAAMSASGMYGQPRICAGIVGHADLQRGDRIGGVLEREVAVAGGRLRGIRQTSAWHPDPAARGSIANPPPGLLLDKAFRQGFARLAPLGLAFDAFLYHTQLDELGDLADAFPETAIVLDHAGSPIGIGPYAEKRNEVFTAWRLSTRELARRPNVCVKLGGFGMRLFGLNLQHGAMPPSSEQVAAAARVYVETCIEAFGSGRCMFESNFPVDKAMCSYTVLWNAFKRLTAECSENVKADLFSKTAARTYGLTIHP